MGVLAEKSQLSKHDQQGGLTSAAVNRVVLTLHSRLCCSNKFEWFSLGRKKNK